MNSISKILLPENIIFDSESTSKKRVFERVGLMFENHHQIPRSTVFESLFAREKLGSTALGHGIAIPHGRISKLKDATAAFVKTANRIPFEAPDGEPVSMLFILLVPERATDHHLQLLGELAQMFSEPAFRTMLSRSDNTDAIYKLFCDWDK